ncbi:TRAP transporter small permease [Ammoniphilus sp. YIM 78166]|uniref:TRAP transporter small permease n=1 Tax=Ammoniphilus sp. YIM 78166 TaxID=1644106 RepID=UPI00106FB6C1|nr:TRAP transporter small permease [Ammoniphilus sp. YIM 78166]
MGEDRLFHKALHSMNRILTFCEWFLLVFACVSLFLIVFVVFYGVIGRELLSLPVLWTNDAAAYLMVYLTFFSIPWILQAGGHVKIDILISSLNKGKIKYLNLMIYTICTMVMAIFFWYSLNITIDSFQRGTVKLDSIPWPEYLLMVPIPIGSFLLCVRFFFYLIEILSRMDNDIQKLTILASSERHEVNRK